MFEKRVVNAIKYPAYFIFLIWAVHLFQIVTLLDLSYLGTYPRTSFGLRGVVFSPLLHSGFPHLINNSIPLFALSGLIYFFFPRVASKSVLMIYVLSGLAVWGFGRSVFHIGASGVVYGLVAFVFWTGIFRRNVKSIVLSLIVGFYYSGMFLGILPNQEGISWESHLLGGVVGIFVAYWLRYQIETDEEPKRYSWEDEPDNSSFFLNRDAFDKTKEERRQDENNDDNWFTTIS